MELWDAYNENGSLVGKDIVRGDKISLGLYHIVVEIIVRHKDGTHLLMQRDWKKKVYPGLFESSASGSVLKGEKPYDGALRELQEETGIVPDKLDQLYILRGKRTFYYGYICEVDIDYDDIILQEGETISYMWLNKEDFLRFFESDSYVESHRERIRAYVNTIK